MGLATPAVTLGQGGGGLARWLKFEWIWEGTRFYRITHRHSRSANIISRIPRSLVSKEVKVENIDLEKGTRLLLAGYGPIRVLPDNL